MVPIKGYTSYKATENFAIIYSTENQRIEIFGIKEGEGSFDIYDSTETKIGKCNVTVKPSSSDYSETKPTSNPADVPYKKGGYTAAELKAMGFSETVKADGTRSYPGFYQAPNGNYFPVN